MIVSRVFMAAIGLVLLAAPIWPTESVFGQGQGIQWVTNFDEALAKAKAENKPVFLDFFNPN
jgi:hypothetical protein